MGVGPPGSLRVGVMARSDRAERSVLQILMALARRTEKTLPELQKFLQAHPVCFTDSGQTKYKLNPSPPIHGRMESAQLHLEIQHTKKRQQQILRWVAISAAIFVASTLLVGFV